MRDHLTMVITFFTSQKMVFELSSIKMRLSWRNLNNTELNSASCSLIKLKNLN